MKKQNHFNRRGFLRAAFVSTGLIFVPSGILEPKVWLYDFHEGRFCPVPRLSGLQASSSIKSRTYSSIVDNRIALSNSNFARPHGVGSWSKLRVALRISGTDSGASLTAPEFAFGLCAGTTNIYKDGTTDHFAGMRTTGNWTRTTNSGILNYQTGGGIWQPFKRIGTTTTTSTNLAGAGIIVSANAATVATRYLLFLDILKGSPNYTFSLFDPNGGNFAADATASDFLTQAVLTTPSFSGHVVNASATLAVDEATNGTLNCVNLYWDQIDPKIELSDLAIVRLS